MEFVNCQRNYGKSAIEAAVPPPTCFPYTQRYTYTMQDGSNLRPDSHNKSTHSDRSLARSLHAPSGSPPPSPPPPLTVSLATGICPGHCPLEAEVSRQARDPSLLLRSAGKRSRCELEYLSSLFSSPPYCNGRSSRAEGRRC